MPEKTLSFWLKDKVVLLVLGGDARIDNQKFKAQFKTKARMLSGNEVVGVRPSCGRWRVPVRPAACTGGVFTDKTLKKNLTSYCPRPVRPTPLCASRLIAWRGQFQATWVRQRFTSAALVNYLASRLARSY